ncbi:MAG TPA: hypothetical protein PKI11_01495 [Candidatus Hydrogenedentes bacterium]|nr:hypothetical protein [Candidatus Hydrogenedentota bacterium]
MGPGPKIAIGLGVAFIVVAVVPLVATIIRGGGVGGPPKEQPMTAAELANTSWEVTVMGHTTSIDLNSGGQAIANVPPQVAAMAKQLMNLDIPPQIPGTWSVSGDQLKLGVEFMGKKEQVTCEIRGKRVFFKEKDQEREARRLR